MSDSELVIRSRQGDFRAFDVLIRRHHRNALLTARRFTAIPEDAEDLVQEAFVAAYQRLSQLKDADRFGGWLTAIIRNEGRMWHRRRFTQPPLVPMNGDEEDSAQGSASVETVRVSLRRDDLRDAIHDALSSLTAGQREAVRLHYIEGYDYRETALLLDIPVDAVRGRLGRARDTLRKELRELAGNTTAWKLNARDLDAIRHAGIFAWNPSLEDRLALNTLYFDGRGGLISTDTHRLFHYRSKSLEAMPAVLIHAGMGRMLREKSPQAAGGQLSLHADKAVLSLDSGDEIEAPLVGETFPDWSKILPQSWEYRVTARTGDWLSAIETLVRQCRAALRDDAGLPKYNRMVLVLSPESERFTLRAGEEASIENGVSWEAGVSFPVKSSSGQRELVMAANTVYIEQAIRALGLGQDDKLEFAANGPLQSFLIRPARRNEVFVITMPMQLEPVAGTT